MKCDNVFAEGPCTFTLRIDDGYASDHSYVNGECKWCGKKQTE